MHGTLKMEKRTPNDVDDAGPIGQHHQHHWGPVSPFARLLGCLWPRPREFHGGFAMGILNPEWVPNCAADVPVRGARARATCTPASAAQLGTHFGLLGARRSQKLKETHQS